MRVSAVIPAYNEEETIADVVRAVREAPIVHEVIVVSDGSTDATAQNAAAAGARVIELEENRGKGGAMAVGVQQSRGEILLFLDGDLVGLTPAHVEELVRPVLKGKAPMTIGIFESGRMATDLAQAIAPYLSGQRAVRRSVLEDLSEMEVSRFGVEIALNRYIKDRQLKPVEVPLRDLTHRMKEEKMGFLKGFEARLKMYWEIIQYFQKDFRLPQLGSSQQKDGEK